MSEIKIDVNKVINACSTAKHQIYEIHSAKMDIARLQSQLSADVKNRYDISGQINRLVSKFDELYSNTSCVISTIESGANQYDHAENRLVNKANLVGQQAFLLDRSITDIVGWIDDGRLYCKPYESSIFDKVDRIKDLIKNRSIDELINEFIKNQDNYSEDELSLIDKIIRDFWSDFTIGNFSINGAIDITGKSFENADTLAVGIVSLLNNIKNVGRSNPSGSGFILISAKDAIRNANILSNGNKISYFLKNGLDAPTLPPFLAKGVGTSAIPVIGGAIDFGLMMLSGENVQDAAIKTVAHVGIGLATANVGAAVGGVIGTFIPIPVVGTVVGAAVGIAVTTVASMAFDAVYDNKDEIAETIGETVTQVSDSISDMVDTSQKWVDDIGKSWASNWNNLGSVFG